jgi:hypothetical protein
MGDDPGFVFIGLVRKSVSPWMPKDRGWAAESDWAHARPTRQRSHLRQAMLGQCCSMIIKVLGALFSSLPAFPLSASLDPFDQIRCDRLSPPSRGGGVEQAACQALRKREWPMNDSP